MKYNRIDRRLEDELRASRPQPRVDFARALTDEVRTRSAPERSPHGRVGLALALSGLIVVALASFGGIGYASSAASHTVKQQAVPQHVWIVEKPKTAAAAQYGKCPPECPATPVTASTPPPTKPSTPCPPECPAVPLPASTSPATKPFTPSTAKPKATVKATSKPKVKATVKAKQGAGVAAAAKAQKPAPKVTSSQLPFTGLALWVPLAIGLILIAFGLVLRTRSRRRHSEAH